MADTDHKRLLKMAAKAAGFDWVDFSGEMNPALGFPANCQRGYWHPLADDGDALRLAVKLRMEIDHNHPADETPWVSIRAFRSAFTAVEEFEDEGQRLAATRLAITRAAAAIGEKMP